MGTSSVAGIQLNAYAKSSTCGCMFKNKAGVMVCDSKKTNVSIISFTEDEGSLRSFSASF